MVKVAGGELPPVFIQTKTIWYMRDYKFRAWDGEKMHYNVVPWRWDFVISESWHRCEKSTGSGVLGSGGDIAEFLVPGIRFKELMQAVGLKDSMRKDIYAGDKVNDRVNNCIVEWDNRSAKYTLAIIYDEFPEGIFQTHKPFPLDAMSLTVIGNIYELNPAKGAVINTMTDPNVKTEATETEVEQPPVLTAGEAMESGEEEG
jgi:hypothetical protein